MQPGEVQRWRLLNATDSENFQLVLVSKANPQQGPGLNVVAMDGITVPKTYHLAATIPIVPPPFGTVAADALVIGPGQRMDVMVKAPATPGTYLLRTIDPNSSQIRASVSPYRDSNFPYGIDPAWRMSRRSFDFPIPCPGGQQNPSDLCCEPTLDYPITLATVVVAGSPMNMNLPADPLPVPTGLPSIATMLNKVPDKVRHIGFELCGGVTGSQSFDGTRPPSQVGPFKPFVSPPSLWLVFREVRCDVLGRNPVHYSFDDAGCSMMSDSRTHDPACHWQFQERGIVRRSPTTIPRHDRRELRRMDDL